MDLQYVIIAFTVLILMVGLSYLLSKKRESDPREYKYKRREKLLTSAELKFYQQLKSEFPDHDIMCKVRLADIIEPAESGKRWGYAFNRIKSKHLDFILINPKTSLIIAGIELDDHTHRRDDRHRRDTFLDSISSQAGLKLVRINPGDTITSDLFL